MSTSESELRMPQWPETLRTLLADVPQWTLPPDRWAEVREVLDQLTESVRANDIPEIVALIGDLVNMDGVRGVVALGESDDEPPPNVRERLTILVHALPDSHVADDQERQ